MNSPGRSIPRHGVHIAAGGSSSHESGAIGIATPNAPSIGASGPLWLHTGTASLGDSGGVSVETGVSTAGNAGIISLGVGDSGDGNGGDVRVFAGRSSDEQAKGGDLVLAAGEGTSPYAIDGGNGGDGTLLCCLSCLSSHLQRVHWHNEAPLLS